MLSLLNKPLYAYQYLKSIKSLHLIWHWINSINKINHNQYNVNGRDRISHCQNWYSFSIMLSKYGSSQDLVQQYQEHCCHKI